MSEKHPSLGSGAVTFHPDRPILHFGLQELPTPPDPPQES